MINHMTVDVSNDSGNKSQDNADIDVDHTGNHLTVDVSDQIDG